MNIKRGWVRLGILAAALLLTGWILYPLQIHHFTPFNSGVSIVIAGLGLIWLVYSIGLWIAGGFKK